ncbi:hypothetical protein TRIP_B40193 [uncultured Desulfatiglans sp.]|uniref:Uncharacterized protein n=1 Tax=Uncultured Desulfatiglans sp. TaxID=1748965 RepID=A0A653AEE1_UNCDX|nr:hypothetical protein TRIP_B40193 [uncultured Desulfatiglans sp.]
MSEIFFALITTVALMRLWRVLGIPGTALNVLIRRHNPKLQTMLFIPTARWFIAQFPRESIACFAMIPFRRRLFFSTAEELDVCFRTKKLC